jgi:hypothetical protein
MTEIYRVNIADANGRYVSCEDEPHHLAGWLFRTIKRLAEDPSWNYYHHQVEFLKVSP